MALLSSHYAPCLEALICHHSPPGAQDSHICALARTPFADARLVRPTIWRLIPLGSPAGPSNATYPKVNSWSCLQTSSSSCSWLLLGDCTTESGRLRHSFLLSLAPDNQGAGKPVPLGESSDRRCCPGPNVVISCLNDRNCSLTDRPISFCSQYLLWHEHPEAQVR